MNALQERQKRKKKRPQNLGLSMKKINFEQQEKEEKIRRTKKKMKWIE
jgi:hypothetical protein